MIHHTFDKVNKYILYCMNSNTVNIKYKYNFSNTIYLNTTLSIIITKYNLYIISLNKVLLIGKGGGGQERKREFSAIINNIYSDFL